jgi:hypothetical protein
MHTIKMSIPESEYVSSVWKNGIFGTSFPPPVNTTHDNLQAWPTQMAYF